jgi:hypothetical protein
VIGLIIPVMFLVNLEAVLEVCDQDKSSVRDNRKNLELFFQQTQTSFVADTFYSGEGGYLYSPAILTALAVRQWSVEELDFIRLLSIDNDRGRGLRGADFYAEADILKIIEILKGFPKEEISALLNKTVPLSVFTGNSLYTGEIKFFDVLRRSGLENNLGEFLIYALQYPDLLQDTLETFQAFEKNGSKENFDQFFGRFLPVIKQVEEHGFNNSQQTIVLKNILRFSRENGIIFADMIDVFSENENAAEYLTPLTNANVDIQETVFATAAAHSAAERITSSELYVRSNIESARKLLQQENPPRTENLGEALSLIEARLGNKNVETIVDEKDSIQGYIRGILIEQLGFSESEILDELVDGIYEIYSQAAENKYREKSRQCIAKNMGDKNLCDAQQAAEADKVLHALEVEYLALYWNKSDINIYNTNSNDYQWLEDMYKYLMNSDANGAVMAIIRGGGTADEIADRLKEAFRNKNSAVYAEVNGSVITAQAMNSDITEERSRLINGTLSYYEENREELIRVLGEDEYWNFLDFLQNWEKYHDLDKAGFIINITNILIEKQREAYNGGDSTTVALSDSFLTILRPVLEVVRNYESLADNKEIQEKFHATDIAYKNAIEYCWDMLSDETKNWYRETLVPRISACEAAREAERRQAEIETARKINEQRSAEKVTAGGGGH